MTIVAATAADVNTAFLERALGGDHGHVADAQTERIGTGQVATTLRATLRWSTNSSSLPTTVVVKVAADDHGTSEALRRATAYRREVYFYQHLAARLTTRTPRCRHAAFDPVTGAFTIVLDEADGVVGDQLRGCTVREVEALLDAAIGLHAPTWNDPSLVDLDWLHPHGPAATRTRADRYRQLLPGFTARYATRLSASVMGVAHWLGDQLETIDLALLLAPCLTHQDMRIDNVLFSHDNGRTVATLLDWQTVGVGSGSADLAYAIGSSLTIDDRREHEWRLVDRYAEQLARHDVIVDADAVRHDYRLGTASGLVMAVIASQVVGRTPRGDELFAVLAERHAQQILDVGLDELLH